MSGILIARRPGGVVYLESRCNIDGNKAPTGDIGNERIVAGRELRSMSASHLSLRH